MKALVYREKNTLDNFAIRLEEVAELKIRETDILVRVRAFGVNPGEAFFFRRWFLTMNLTYRLARGILRNN